VAVPFVDLEAIHEPIRDILLHEIAEVVRSNHFIMGPKVAAFEHDFAALLNVKTALGISSGSDALIAALSALGIGPGDEVITTPYTFFATTEAILRVGAIPRFVDIQADSFNIDPALIPSAISSKTRAILVVHLFGRSADMGTINRIAGEHGLKVIEDAAQAVGAEWNGSRVGGLGDIGCFSFFPAKNLGAFGDGGAVTTNDPQLAERMRIIRIHGSERRYQHTVLGGNYRLDAIQAAVLRLKLPYLEQWTSERQDAAFRYRELFQGRGLEGQITLPDPGPGRHVYNQFVIRVHEGRRDLVFDELGKRDIGRAVYYPLPCHQQPLIRAMTPDSPAMPEAEKAAQDSLAIPVAPGLRPDQQEEVVEAIIEVLRS
jgi:dTDP-4-amino-4,6-dideoxygalactose transaminase